MLASRNRPRPLLSAALRLSVGDIVPGGKPQAAGEVVARDLATGRALAKLSWTGVFAAHGGAIELTHRLADQAWPAPPQAVQLVARPHPLVGIRWWLVDPDGHGRVGAIFLPVGATRFASRSAHGLAYPSEGLRAPARAAARARRIRVSLGGPADLTAPFPERPRGMWATTYQRRRAAALGT